MAEFDHKYTPQRCDEDDPRRCTADTRKGRCIFQSVPGASTCVLHGGQAALKKADKQELYNIRHTRVMERIGSIRANPEAIKLSTELAICRMSLEDLLNTCKDDYDRMRYSSQIIGLVKAINDTLTSNMKIEQKLGELLNASQVASLAQDLFNAVIIHLGDDLDTLSLIADDFENILNTRLLSD